MPTDTSSVGIRLNVFDVNDWNHPNCVPSCTLVGSDTEIVALVSKSAVFVRVRSQVEVVVDASTRVTVSSTAETLTPGALTMTISPKYCLIPTSHQIDCLDL